MFKFLLIIGNIYTFIYAGYFNDYEDNTQMTSRFIHEDHEFTPIITLTKDNEKIVAAKNINCDDFPKYVNKCKTEAALIYNSSRKVPPMPDKIPEWCSAMRHLTNCATDWNADCRDVTESHFNDESINGHVHVISGICDDDWFLKRYELVPDCIRSTEDAWEKCYSQFKNVVEDKKNTSNEWTHYETHFYLCCARALFRRCTLELLFERSNNCTKGHAVILQRFSVIVSEGDVFQDCDVNVMYANCPDGDPRPNDVLMSKLVMAGDFENEASVLSIQRNLLPWCTCVQFMKYLLT